MSDNEKWAALEDAITNALRSQGSEGLLVEWVVVTASRGYTDDGRGYTEYGTIVPNDIPAHHVMGLLEIAGQGGPEDE